MGVPGTTPSPWSLRFSGDWLDGIQGSPDEGERYGEMVVNRGIAKPKSPRGLANAHQIAASGELYDALEGVCLVLSGMPMTGMESERRLQAGIAALARARGEQPA